MAACMRRFACSSVYRMCTTLNGATTTTFTYLRDTRLLFHTAGVNTDKYRKVQETTEGDVTTVEAEYVSATAATKFINEEYKDACPICRLNLKVTYKDVLILSQFIKEDGSMLPKRITGVCSKQHLNLVECIKRAHKAGLLPDHKPKEKMVLPPGIQGKKRIRLPRF
ncbi:39S ribosomal protein S18a, mitochondrial-like [Anneissia japonica]|uniref:39S ribosomal protein S18a, mitochondrial-like n=1 Tax=Anneissia japonica TaxID=1529436 RepID=UPI00142559C8|nr:39S ribosomal protein S18a, mitochondrial-like [Anneissia japonica]